MSIVNIKQYVLPLSEEERKECSLVLSKHFFISANKINYANLMEELGNNVSRSLSPEACSDVILSKLTIWKRTYLEGLSKEFIDSLEINVVSDMFGHRFQESESLLQMKNGTVPDEYMPSVMVSRIGDQYDDAKLCFETNKVLLARNPTGIAIYQ